MLMQYVQISVFGLILLSLSFYSLRFLRGYLSFSGQIKDFYISMVLLCIVGYSFGQVYCLILGKLDLHITVFVQMQLTWAYWFLMMYAFKRAHFRKAHVRRLHYMIFTTFLLYINFCLVVTNLYLTLPHLDTLPILMQVSYVMNTRFNIINEVSRILILLSGIWLSLKIYRNLSCLFFSFSFLLIAEGLSSINHFLVLSPNYYIFHAVQFNIIISLVFLVLELKEQRKEKNRYG